jgi:hypothetical protein
LDKPTGQQLQAIGQTLQRYQQYTDEEKMQFDSILWSRTIDSPGNAYKGEILKRVFTVLRWGGLDFLPRNQNNWRRWTDVGWPIATALSHGGRVMIQLPRTDPRSPHEKDHRFFDWLTRGQKGTAVCFERQGTHSTGNLEEEQCSELLDGRMKVLRELHGSSHGGAQAVKVSKGKSYGINLALGGNLHYTFATDVLITDNGCHGHLYIFYRPPTKQMFGGVLIGCEGEAPGCYGASGNFHSWNLAPVDKLRGHKPSRHEGQFGPKWSQGFQLPLPQQQQFINGPAQYDSMIVDLTAGWEFLQHLGDTFTSSMVEEAAVAPQAIPHVPKSQEWMKLLKDASIVPALGLKKYERLSVWALQLRLALLIKLKDVAAERRPLRSYAAWQNEYNSLVRAIYGD